MSKFFYIIITIITHLDTQTEPWMPDVMHVDKGPWTYETRELCEEALMDYMKDPTIADNAQFIREAKPPHKDPNTGYVREVLLASPTTDARYVQSRFCLKVKAHKFNVTGE